MFNKIYGNKYISMTFTAGADISPGQVVYISGDREVSPATSDYTAQCIGVSISSASQGEPVDVIIYGVVSVIADGTINAGDRVIAGTNPGNVLSENEMPPHTHTISVSDPGHSHLGFSNSGTDAAPATAATQLVVGGDGTTATNVYVTVESGAASEDINTSTNITGITASNSSDSSGQHGRCIGIALESSSAGNPVLILVCKI